jgi:uncharacterized membrane protein YecN with MAPEG domain
MVATHAAALLYIGLTIVVLVFLSVRVSLTRRRLQVPFGTGGNAQMERVVRGQENFAEYAALFLIALCGLAFAREPDWVIHVLGILFLVGRIVYAWAIAQEGPVGFMPGRALGMFLTWGPLLAAAVMLIGIAVTGVR